ncbi:hypothetical protein [Kosakonia cowanii]|uniref:hypothetical protein n=1 Tax=Kosakonia cowanii TaxID=208223 RepID=UPI004062A2F3
MPGAAFDAIDFWSKVGVGIITGAVAALLTAKITLKRFYHEKWWERKHQAYNDLVNNLFELQVFFRNASNRARKERMGKSFSEDLDWERSVNLHIAIQRQLALAPISLSKKTNDLVHDFFEQSHSQDWSMHNENMPSEVVYDEKVKLLKNVIHEITHDAKKELKFR